MLSEKIQVLYFRVADVCFSIAAPEVCELKRMLPSYAPFNIPRLEEKLILQTEVRDGEVSSDPVGEELGQFDCGGTNHGIYKTADGYKVVISTVEKNLACAMLVNANFSQCTISLFGSPEDRRFGLGNAMMLAFAFSAAYYNIILMHASVTLNAGYGYLFLGKSGTGKSTHSKLWRQYIEGSDLLNDDNPAVKACEDGRIIVYGTPWSGKTPCYRNMQVPVGAIVRLEQAPKNEIKREPMLHAFASVLSSCSTMIWDKPSYWSITQTVEQVAKHTPVFYLKCLPDEAAARLSYLTIKHNG